MGEKRFVAAWRELAVPHICLELDEQLFALQQARTLCGGAGAQRSFQALMLRPIERHRSAYRPMGQVAQKTKKNGLEGGASGSMC